MAIINSIALGKSRGKIGNIVTATLKGQVIAKERNFSPANPKTVLQVSSRAKMSNAVLAWQFLSQFFAMAMALRKSTESTYNAFVRLSKNYFSNVISASRSLAAGELLDISTIVGNWITVALTDTDAVSGSISLNTGGLPYNPLARYRVITFDTASGSNVIIDNVITEIQWNAGAVSYAGGEASSVLHFAYLYTSDGSKISNLATAGF